jgi:hypothetical protein
MIHDEAGVEDYAAPLVACPEESQERADRKLEKYLADDI